MNDPIDYFEMENGSYVDTSYNGYLQALIKKIRYVREDIPANQISDHGPDIQAKQAKLHSLDATFGNDERDYIQEIMEYLENEPQPDDFRNFNVFELSSGDNGQAVLVDAYENSHDRRRAEWWVKQSGTPGIKYVILEILTP